MGSGVVVAILRIGRRCAQAFRPNHRALKETKLTRVLPTLESAVASYFVLSLACFCRIAWQE